MRVCVFVCVCMVLGFSVAGRGSFVPFYVDFEATHAKRYTLRIARRSINDIDTNYQNERSICSKISTFPLVLHSENHQGFLYLVFCDFIF